jgi:hypothetical protein
VSWLCLLYRIRYETRREPIEPIPTQAVAAGFFANKASRQARHLVAEVVQVLIVLQLK